MPIIWVCYYLFCCCIFKGSGEDSPSSQSEDGNYIAQLKSNLNNLKRKKINEDVKTIYSMVKLLKKEPYALSYLCKLRVNPKLTRMDVENQE